MGELERICAGYSLWGLIGLKQMLEQPRVNETRYSLDLGGLNGNRESVLTRLNAEVENGTGCIVAVYKKDDILEVHSRACISKLVELLGISRKDIEIY